MNFLRSLPCSALSSASLEQASDSGLRGFSAFLAGVVAAGAAAGAAVCASAEPAKNSEAMATAAMREEIFIMEAPLRRERATTSRCHDEPCMNGPEGDAVYFQHGLARSLVAGGCSARMLPLEDQSLKGDQG